MLKGNSRALVEGRKNYRMSQDSVVLSFHENLLRESDIKLLRGPLWFNDTIISFYFEYLQTVPYKDDSSILFVSPEVTQCVKVIPAAETPIFLDPLHAPKKDFIFFALNDNERTDRAGGFHWSLLVFSKPEKSLFHFDSHQGSNYSQARDLSDKLLGYFEINPRNNFVEYETLQQSNGYDCGVHVLCNTDLIAKHAKQYNAVSGCGVVQRDTVMQKRKELLDLIYSLKSS